MSQELIYAVSVCITTYNMEAYIARALDSVLMQRTSFPFQIIVSDDASTDGTIAILEAYRERVGEQMVILKAAQNNGLIGNFVKLLKNSNGKYIATLDADDYWVDESKLQKQYNILQECNDIGYVFTNYFNEDEELNTRSAGLKKSFEIAKDPYVQMVTSPYVQISTPMFRTDLLDFTELDVFVQLQFEAQDYPLFTSFSLKTKGYYLNEYSTVYTIRANSMSNPQHFGKWLLNRKKCFAIGDYFINKYPVPQENNNRRIFTFQFNNLLAAWKTGCFDTVRQHAANVALSSFIKFNFKALYIYIASKNRFLYTLLKPWVLRHRKRI